MSELKAKDLLQAKALGCLDPDEESAFGRLMQEDKNFPWQELGNYQNIVSHLPILLDLENTSNEVKQIVMNKVSDMIEAKKTEELSQEIPDISIEKNQDIVLDDADVDVVLKTEDNSIELDDEAEPTEKPVKKEISFKQHGVLQTPIGDKIKTAKTSSDEKGIKENLKEQTSSSKKGSNRKSVRSHISKSPVYIEPKAINEPKKSNLIPIILSNQVMRPTMASM